MKNKLFVALAVATLTVGLAGFGFYAYTYSDIAAPELEASLSAGASLDGPVGVADSSYDLSAHQTLSRVILLIRENYVEPERIKPYDMFLAALEHIEKTVPEVLVDDAAAPRRIRVAVGAKEQLFDLGGLDQLWEVTMALRDIFRFLQSHIVDTDRRRDIEYAAINGMLSTLDPHSVLLKPESFNEVKLSTKGEFGGLGIVISIRDAALTIISPIAGTPASRAGLKAKDKIVKIDEESTVNMSLEEAVHRLRGKPGSKVAVWVLRKNWTEPRRFLLTRAIIKIESVTSELLDSSVGYIRIKSFQNNTFDDLHTHLERLRTKNRGQLKGLVLDLRNNPGGLLDQAILVSDRFIDRGPLVITVGEGNRKRDAKPAHFSGTESDYPVAVLVNGGSASASEIVAGALKNHNRGLVIGQQTFGKGSVQVLYDFKDKSALKLTIAQYLTPGDISIQSVGITPDIEVRHGTITKDNLHLFVHDDSPREKDLEMHLRQHRTNKGSGARPMLSMTHYVPEEDETEEEEEVDPDKFVMDFEISLARDILAKATARKRRVVLDQANPLMEQRKAEEDVRIGEQLTGLGADWSVADSYGTPRAEAILQTSKSGNAMKAGDEVDLIATVKNTGDGPLYRVYGTTESDNPLFNRQEFAFGKLMPGEKKTWKVHVKIPRDMHARADEVTLRLGDHHGKIKGTSSAMVAAVDELAKPRFSYTAQLDDRAKGNGDGVLQTGEEIDFKVNVSNLGVGAAEDTVVTVKNLAGSALFLDRGRDKLGELKAGATKTATLRFHLREPKDDVEIRVSVWDASLGASISETVMLPVTKQRKVKPDRRSLKVGDAAVSVYSGAHDSAAVIGQAKPGSTLRADASVGMQGRWRRVDLGAGRTGFVRADSVTLLKGSRRPTRNGVKLSPGQAPPEITLDLTNLVTSGDALRLTGNVKDEEGLRDIFVFVNEKKVFYRSFDTVQSEDGVYSTPLELNLPLEKGTNAVAVVVRESDDVVSRRIFGIYRAEANAVAGLENETTQAPQ